MVRFDSRLAALALGALLFDSSAFAQTAQAAPPPVMVARPVAQPAAQPTRSYLKVDGVSGESMDPAHQGWIEISAFQWGSKANASGAAARTAAREVRPSISTLVVTKAMDKASVPLQKAAAEGQHFKTVVLEFVSRSKNEHYQVTMNDVLVSSLRLNSSSERPTESVTLQFAKFEIKYGTLDAQGNRGPLQAVPATLDVRQVVPN